MLASACDVPPREDPSSVTGLAVEDPDAHEAALAATAEWEPSDAESVGEDSSGSSVCESDCDSMEGVLSFVDGLDGGSAGEHERTAAWFEEAMKRATMEESTRAEFRDAMKGLGLDRKSPDESGSVLEQVFCDRGCPCTVGLCRLRDLDPSIDVTELDVKRTRCRALPDHMKTRAWVSMRSAQYHAMAECRRREIEDHVRTRHGKHASLGLEKGKKFTRGSNGTSRYRAVAFAAPASQRTAHTKDCTRT